MTDQHLTQIKNNDDFHVKYKIHKKPIGKGSFSTVYLGTDKHNNLVAIKQISLSKIKSTYMDKFLRELDISMKLDHPNIVKCYEIFKTEKHWYIVNEYCDCGTLQDLLPDLSKYNQQQRESVVRKILNELKEALKYLITNSIIHRDLKPSNILIKKTSTDNYPIKLADFGFARYFSNEITDEGHDDMVSTICGSPIYMAPELLINLKYNMKADLWSFGVIMYELLYGVNPYYFPKNIPELRKLMIEKQIKYDDLFSFDCIDLLKSLLVIDPEKRIGWRSFFLHRWFTISVVNPKTNEETKATVTNIGTSNQINPEPDIESNIKTNIKESKDDFIEREPQDILAKIIPLEIISSGTVTKKEMLQSNINIKYGDQKPENQKSEYRFENILLSVYIDPKYKEEETLSDLDFEMINIDDIEDNQIPEYNTYHESSTGSLIKILSNSIRSIWNYGSSPTSTSLYGTPPSGKSPPNCSSSSYYGKSPPSSSNSSRGKSPPSSSISSCEGSSPIDIKPPYKNSPPKK